MNGALVEWWRLRTQREQRLLLVMVTLLAAVLAWLLVVRPLGDMLDTAKRDHAEAVTALAEARARAGAAERMRAAPAAPAPRPIDAFVSRTATEAGFGSARIAAQGPERASIVIEAARPQAFFAWIGQMERSGLAVESLRARPNPDRTLAVEAVLRARTD